MTDLREAALLPCPFCGGEATLTDIENARYRYVMCLKCGACCNNADTMPEAECVDAWNRRAAEEGRVSVPTIPTKEMIDAFFADGGVGRVNWFMQGYRAMLAAAEKEKGL